VLSDGTLRLLALVALKNEPQHSGLLCFEEAHTQLPARLLFADITTRIQPGKVKPLRVTRVIPVISPHNYNQLTLDLGLNEPELSYTLKQVIDYLNSADVGEAVDTLQGGVNS
jgi:hypothetical protein